MLTRPQLDTRLLAADTCTTTALTVATTSRPAVPPHLLHLLVIMHQHQHAPLNATHPLPARSTTGASTTATSSIPTVKLHFLHVLVLVLVLVHAHVQLRPLRAPTSQLPRLHLPPPVAALSPATSISPSSPSQTTTLCPAALLHHRHQFHVDYSSPIQLHCGMYVYRPSLVPFPSRCIEAADGKRKI